nr:MAG TPA: hypothetical protein [Caudoviricetes sp.]
MKHARWKRFETSKKLLVASYGAAFLLTAGVAAGSFFSTHDMTALSTLAALAWGEVSVATGFYLWKARAENKIKVAKQMMSEWADKYGIESVVSIIDIVSKE